MLRFWTLIGVVGLALGVAGCGGRTGDVQEGVPKDAGYVAPPSPGMPGQGGFGEMKSAAEKTRQEAMKNPPPPQPEEGKK